MGAKVLVIGGGGREHALAWKLAQSPHVSQVYVAPGNGGTAGAFQNVDIGFTDVPKLLAFAQENKIDLTVIGQEAASAAGAVDAFQQKGLRIFGPTQAATQIESSKAFAKELMKKQGIPTAGFQKFSDVSSAQAYIDSKPFPLVIKASGLAEGKGVVIAENRDQALAAIDDMMVKKVFKDSGNTIVIEEFLIGEEISVHALCDGKKALLFPASQDHKQIYDGGKGPNTGGMGVVAPLPWASTALESFVYDHVVQPTLKGMQAKNAPFVGCLYPGLMIDSETVKVLEFNARFGDPEAQTYMRLLTSDLYEILVACTEGSLEPANVQWRQGYAISVAVASGGYPGAYPKGVPITGIEAAEKLDDIVVFQAGTALETDGLKTAGGRVLYITATGDSIEQVREKAYQAVECIKFEGMHYRTDIGVGAIK